MKSNVRTDWPLGYLITFTTYGTWLHGNKSGSIEKKRGEKGASLIGINKNLENYEKSILKSQVFVMSTAQQKVVLNSILGVCKFRKWDAYAIHIRTNHIHAVIAAFTTPEKIMNDFKIYATKSLRKTIVGEIPEKLWTRHGSTKYLWNEKELLEAVNYVKYGQGKMMTFGESVNIPIPTIISSNEQ